MTVVICPECGDRGNISYDQNEGSDTKYYKIQHSKNQGKKRGEISYCYLGKEDKIEWKKIRKAEIKAGDTYRPTAKT